MSFIIAVFLGGAGLAIGWLLASLLSSRAAAMKASEFEETRNQLQTRLAEQGQLLEFRQNELTSVRQLLDESHLQVTASVEQRARFEALYGAAQDVAVARETEIVRLRQALSESHTTRDSMLQSAATLQADNARYSALLEQERKAHENQLQIYRDAEEQLKATLKVTAADALRSNNEAFLALAQTKMSELQHRAAADFDQKQKAIQDVVGPVTSLLQKLEAEVKVAEHNRVETRTEILAQVRQVATLVPSLQRETSQLARALTHSGTRGRWGELQLRRTLELAGLVEGQHFAEQVSVESDDGRLRPDVIVHLPGGSNIVIDAKAPMKAFLAAHATEDDQQRVALLEEHVVVMRQHVTQLGTKGYAAHVQPSPDFVVMFVPVEAAFNEALRADIDLLEFAAKRDVIPTGPLALIAILRAIAFGWRQHAVAERAEEIAAVGGELLDRIATVLAHVARVGHGLDRSVDAYNKAVASFESRLLPSVRDLHALHVRGTKEPQALTSIDRRARILALPEVSADSGGLDGVDSISGQIDLDPIAVDQPSEPGQEFAGQPG